MKNNQWISIILFVIFTLCAGIVQAASPIPETNQSFALSCPAVIDPTPSFLPQTKPEGQSGIASQNEAVHPTGDVLACIRSYEGGYTSVNPAGYYGAYQFAQGTWNSTASVAGRTDLVGKNPAQVAPIDQDAMATVLIARRGLSPWPTPNRLCR